MSDSSSTSLEQSIIISENQWEWEIGRILERGEPFISMEREISREREEREDERREYERE